MSWLKTLKNILSVLVSPPERARVYRDYNRTRQLYILEAAARHFDKREDDPAPLFGKSLLDVGCGESTIGEFLALSGAEVTAVDPSAESLEKAQASAEKYGAPITFVQSRAEDILNSLPRFDVILALDILEDSNDAGKLMWVLRQLLNPGGVIVFSAINRTPKAWLIHKFLSEYVYHRVPVGTRSYRRFYRPAQLKELAEKHKLDLTNIQGLAFHVVEQNWVLTNTPDTRYMAMATPL